MEAPAVDATVAVNVVDVPAANEFPLLEFNDAVVGTTSTCCSNWSEELPA
jgi:hypothetical protein